MKLKRTVYDQGDNAVVYTLRDRLFGPRVSKDDIVDLEFRAMTEGWLPWFGWIDGMRNKRRRRWLLAYLRDGVIAVQIHVIGAEWDDDDPYEGMG